jgi:hypothetical protein
MILSGSDSQLPFHQTSVKLNTKLMLSDIGGKIIFSIHQPNLMDKISRDTRWDDSVANSVDWSSSTKALQHFSKPSRVKFTKMMFDLNQTNSKNISFMEHHHCAPVVNGKSKPFLMSLAETLPHQRLII